MNAKDLTFGIEIETYAPVANNLRIGGRHEGLQVTYLPAGWKAEHDGSIRGYPAGYTDCEIVSPVLQGAEGIAQLIEVLGILEARGHKVNQSCGVHVHVGWSPDWPSDALARLVTIVSYAEKGLYAITGSKNRERGTYCKGVRSYGAVSPATQSLQADRYHALNLTNLGNGSKRTVEFRIFSGSTNATKIVGWIQVCLGMVERAINGKRNPSWMPKPLSGGWKKAGEGASEAERLMGYLAWGTGYARIHNGLQYGWISDAIPQDAIKKEFRRLAEKYDAQQ